MKKPEKFECGQPCYLQENWGKYHEQELEKLKCNQDKECHAMKQLKAKLDGLPTEEEMYKLAYDIIDEDLNSDGILLSTCYSAEQIAKTIHKRIKDGGQCLGKVK